MKRYMKHLIGVLVIAVAAIALAQAPTALTIWSISGTEELRLDANKLGPVSDTGLTLGSQSLEWGNIFSNATVNGKHFSLDTSGAVSLTSPSVTIDLSQGSVIQVTTDANQTGATLSNGTPGYIYILYMGAGSNTLRFDDDALNLALGGNITLTEGQADALILYCYAADDYLCLSDRSGN